MSKTSDLPGQTSDSESKELIEVKPQKKPQKDPKNKLECPGNMDQQLGLREQKDLVRIALDPIKDFMIKHSAHKKLMVKSITEMIDINSLPTTVWISSVA